MCEVIKFSQLSQDFPDLKISCLGDTSVQANWDKWLLWELRWKNRNTWSKDTGAIQPPKWGAPGASAGGLTGRQGRKKVTTYHDYGKCSHTLSSGLTPAKLFLAFLHLEPIYKAPDSERYNRKWKQTNQKLKWLQHTCSIPISCYFSYWIDSTPWGLWKPDLFQ